MIKLEPFLLPTEFCDSDNPEIETQAHRIVDGEKKLIKKAILIKEWVGSRIIYRFDFLNVKASQTLKKGFGQCTNKANLQIALLRASGIPAAYGVVAINKEVFKEVTPPEFYKKIAQPTTHVYCQVYDLKLGRWRHFDTTVHKDLQRVYKSKNIELRTYTPQGESRYREKYLASEISTLANLDHLFKVPPRWLNEKYIKLANEYLENLEKEVQ